MGRIGLQWVCNGLQWVAVGCSGLRWVAMRRGRLQWVRPGILVIVLLTFLASVGVLDLAVGGVLRPGGQLPHVGENKVQRGPLPEPEGQGFLYARRSPGVSKGSAKPVVALRRNRSRGAHVP